MGAVWGGGAAAVSDAMSHAGLSEPCRRTHAAAAGDRSPTSSVERGRQIGRLTAIVMDTTCRCPHPPLMMLLLLLLVAGGTAVRSPFRGEMSAVPRGRDVLLRNIASGSRQPRNGVGVTRSSPGKPLH